MRISVITVCLNSELTIERTLKSVAEQTWPNIEHIIIDGKSTDKTLSIIDKYSQKISYFVSESDHGIYDAMNKGLSLATGDVICFLNADDCYASSKILTRVAKEISSQKLDALFGDVAFFKASNLNKQIRRYRSDRFTPERLAWGWMPAHPALFLTKPVVDRVGLFNPSYKIAGDFEYIVRAFYHQNIKYIHIPEVMVNMLIGGVSTSGLRSKIQLNKEVLKACRENGLKTNLLKILSKYPLKFSELILK